MSQPRVIGTAGHIDHGKSTLVQALTGIHPDRLPEERARNLTIDLGFAWLQLDDGSPIGIVDVPGHRDFIQNMLAGVGGIDAAILVIAADEGVMPQTQEHLNILHLLGIPRLIVAMTKCDLVDDDDWLTLVQLDIADVLETTTFAEAKIIPVSAQTGKGLTEFRTSLAHLLKALPPISNRGRPRLPIDRVFTLDGFGTIVTGTLRDGSLHVGEEIHIAPIDVRARIRALQCYEQPVDEAPPGARVAVNLSGLRGEKLHRGQVLARRGELATTRLVDANYQHLPKNPFALKHNTEVKIYAGSAECTARLRLLGTEQLTPGDEGWLQLRLDQELALAEGDRYILRIPSPALTIGGGVIVDPQPKRRWKRFSNDRLQILETRLRGNPVQRLTQLATIPIPIPVDELKFACGLSAEEFDLTLHQAVIKGQLVPISADFVQETKSFQQLQSKVIDFLSAFHERHPLSFGISQEELRSRLQCSTATINAILIKMSEEVTRVADRVSLIRHEIRFNEEQQQRIEQLAAAFERQPTIPPTPHVAAKYVGSDVWYALLERGDYILVASDVAFAQKDYEHFCAKVLQTIDNEGSISASRLRDQLQTSRKFAIALLEHLDERGVTKREGDARVRGPHAADYTPLP